MPNEPNFYSFVHTAAAYRAAYFIVQSYYQRGFDCDRTVRRLQTLMTRSRRAGLWTADQYTLSAEIYIDVIHRIYNRRVTFQPAVE